LAKNVFKPITIQEAFTECDEKHAHYLVEYVKWLDETFEIKFMNNFEDLTNPTKKIPGFVIAQNHFFKWLDVSMLMTMWIQAGDYNADPILKEDAMDFRLNIQDLHMDHVLDILLFSVGQTEDAFEKPYQLSNYNNDLVFNHKHYEILNRFFYIWEEYMYCLHNPISSMTGPKYV
jgi:hypothetical protein